MFDKTCLNDPQYYQICGFYGSFSPNPNTYSFCGQYVCAHKFYKYGLPESTMQSVNQVCDGTEQCSNTKLDEENCDQIVTLPTGISIQKDRLCDAVCDLGNCEDEGMCNDKLYGVYCKDYWGRLTYAPPVWICNDFNNCQLTGEDEQDCDPPEDPTFTCVQNNLKNNQINYRNYEKEVKLFNFTRCAPILYSSDSMPSPYCENFIDQTNCTDPERVGMSCLINGALSTVSIFMVCHQIPGIKLCDDELENRCLLSSASCGLIHKHLLCDGNADCPDNSDEQCKKDTLTMRTCVRRYGKRGQLRIPLTWLYDDVQDCEDGLDEDPAENWATCGRGHTERFVTEGTICQDVFLCPSSGDVVVLNDLCDGIETCVGENRVCKMSRGRPEISTTVISSDNITYK